MWSLLQSGELLEHAAISTTRLGIALVVAIVLAVPLGFAMGLSSRLDAYVDPLVELLRPISGIAWIPLGLFIFGIGDTLPVFIMVYVAFFPLLLNTVAGVRQVDRKLVAAARTMGVGRGAMLRHVIVPAALPTVMVGLRLAFAGAWAAIVRKSDGKRGILSAFMRSDGALAELLWRPSGGAKQPFSLPVLEDRSSFVHMAGREVFKHAVRSMAEACDRALDGARLTGKDIDLLIPHQANVRIIEATAKHANVSMDKVYVNVNRFGNTSSASIGIALDEAISSGRVRSGDTVLLCAFGAGFTWGSMVVRL